MKQGHTKCKCNSLILMPFEKKKTNWATEYNFNSEIIRGSHNFLSPVSFFHIIVTPAPDFLFTTLGTGDSEAAHSFTRSELAYSKLLVV